MTFMDKLRKDISVLESVDDEIDRWHAEDHKLSLQAFLGMTEEEYTIFISSSKLFEEYIKKQRK